MINSPSDAVGFVLVGTLLPCVFFAVTGTPIVLGFWLLACSVYVVAERTRRRA